MTEGPNKGNTEVAPTNEQIRVIADSIDDSSTSARSGPNLIDGILTNGATIERGDGHNTGGTTEPEHSEAVCTVLVAIPAYNEAATIGDVAQRASKYADHVLVIDDGSEDNTAVLANETGVTVVEHGRNRGYGAALKTAFETAYRFDTRHLVVLDGDGQHDPSDIPRLVAAQERTGAHLVIGSRFVDGATSNASLYRRMGLKTINALTNLSLGVIRSDSRVSDTQSGFRAYNREAVQSLATDKSIGNSMDASTDILYHAHHRNYAIEEVAVAVEYDVANASTQAPLSHGVVLVRNILKTIERERPLTALAVPGFGLTFGGLGFGYWTATNYIQSGTFPVGLALTAAFLMLVGTFACFTAIVLHALSTYFSNTEIQRGQIR
ncbi:glycosyltransferase family 2 protein [Halocatena marina]|uniref:glycosyltransferase family 2 protein n=1 Tax=Halocatena marina TaxID=2934937 RepID=UPI00200F341F|nr:glycosyltransferase family 2 protein [Halocatena marina]